MCSAKCSEQCVSNYWTGFVSQAAISYSKQWKLGREAWERVNFVVFIICHYLMVLLLLFMQIMNLTTNCWRLQVPELGVHHMVPAARCRCSGLHVYACIHADWIPRVFFFKNCLMYMYSINIPDLSLHSLWRSKDEDGWWRLEMLTKGLKSVSLPKSAKSAISNHARKFLFTWPLLGEFPVNRVFAWEYTTSRFCEDGWIFAQLFAQCKSA